MSLITDNGISRVWREDGWIWKRQPKYMTDNEIYALLSLKDSGYVPYAEQVDIELIRMQDLGEGQPVTNREAFMAHEYLVLAALQRAGIRHGDLTKYAVIVRGNKPYLIDFGESRMWDDPRPDKRREGDAYWLHRTMEELCQGL